MWLVVWLAMPVDHTAPFHGKGESRHQWSAHLALEATSFKCLSLSSPLKSLPGSIIDENIKASFSFSSHPVYSATPFPAFASAHMFSINKS